MITKRQLGFIFIVLGALSIGASFARDLLGGSDFQGIGPLQQAALAAGALVIFVGLTLLPLGDRPA